MAKKESKSDLKGLAIIEAFTLAEKDPFAVWVAYRDKPDANIGYVEAIDVEQRLVTIGVEGKGHFERKLKELVLYSQPKKKLVYPPIHNSLYTLEHVHDLIARAINLRNYRNQWENDSAFSSGADAHFQLKAIVELLENITVFNIGDGANGFRQSGKSVGSSLSDRLDSFVVAYHYHSASNKLKKKRPEPEVEQ